MVDLVLSHEGFSSSTCVDIAVFFTASKQFSGRLFDIQTWVVIGTEVAAHFVLYIQFSAAPPVPPLILTGHTFSILAAWTSCRVGSLH